MSFQYTIFDVISIDEVERHYSAHDPSTVLWAYLNWLHSFSRKSSIFYRMQFQAHRIYVSKQFEEITNQSVEDIQTEADQRRWDELSDAAGLTRHWHISQRAADAFGGLNEYTQKELSLDKLIVRQLDRYELSLTHPDLKQENLDALWFNKVIANPADEVIRLRAIPYGDYLRTDHWRRVRNAMLLINGARCQSKRCSGLDSYWLGWEVDLHVHHLTYKNRGNERFEDLQLLCKNCHADAHQNNGAA